MRHVPPGLGRADHGRRPRNPDLVTRQRSSRRGVTGVEKIPRHPERRATPVALVPRIKTTSTREEAKFHETHGQEERDATLRHHDRLLLFPAVLRDIRHRLLRGEHCGKRWSHYKSKFRGGFDRAHQIVRKHISGVRVEEIRKTKTFDLFWNCNDDFHGGVVCLLVSEG